MASSLAPTSLSTRLFSAMGYSLRLRVQVAQESRHEQRAKTSGQRNFARSPQSIHLIRRSSTGAYLLLFFLLVAVVDIDLRLETGKSIWRTGWAGQQQLFNWSGTFSVRFIELWEENLTRAWPWSLTPAEFRPISAFEHRSCCYCCCLHIKPLFLPNDISSTPSVLPDSYPRDIQIMLSQTVRQRLTYDAKSR